MAADLSGRDLAWPERRRAEPLGLFRQVGDFRRGPLNAVRRKCGKPAARRRAGAPGPRAAVDLTRCIAVRR